MILVLVRRCAQAFLVIAAVGLVAFAMFRFVGDPVLAMVGQDASPAERAELREALGLEDPVLAQFGRFASRAARGDFGISLQRGRPVGELILERLPATLELAVVASALALLLGLPLGVWTAVRDGTRGADAVMAGSLLGVSLPTFVIGIGLILVFSVNLGWLPSHGRGETQALGWWRTGLLGADGWRHLILPAATLAIFQVALLVRLVRAEMVHALRSEHVRFARARGLAERRVLLRHALPGALPPVVTVTGVQFGSLIAFSIITESVFQWPGLGLLFLQAIQASDIPVMAGYLCLTGALFAAINLVVDIVCLAIDPRLREPAPAAASA
jgi:peptide/nickel transport system permease protein